MGLFVTFEGLDGSGKSTQVELISEKLMHMGYSCVCLREPGETNVGESVREILLDRKNNVGDTTEVLLYAAARAQLVEEIKPALKIYDVVLCDRYVDSSFAYAQIDEADVAMINRVATGGVWPDRTYLIDITVETMQQRLGEARDRIESRDVVFHEQTRQRYLSMATQEPERFCVVDGTLSQEDIRNQAVADIVSTIEPD